MGAINLRLMVLGLMAACQEKSIDINGERVKIGLTRGLFIGSG